MDMDDFVKMAMRSNSNSDSNSEPLNEQLAKSQEGVLRDFYRQYNINEEIGEGDIVVWKQGLKNVNFPAYNQRCIVMKKYAEPVLDNKRESNSPYFREPLDIVVGFIHDNDFLQFHLDSKRFKKVKSNTVKAVK